jgi:hypothetical protein
MLSERMRAMVRLYNRGLELYKKRRFQEAEASFRKALEHQPDDGPCRLYISRCRELIENPPPDDWDGVFTMTSK